MSRLRNPGMWIALLSAGAVVSFTVLDVERESPGPLTTVHDRVPELEGGKSCSACHGSWWTSMADACLSCHEPVEAQIEDGTGLHGGIDAAQVSRCALCHSEHHGAGFAMVNAQSFALAGVPDVAEFDHGRIGFDMRGKHLEAECSACHANAETPVLPEGELRFLGLSQDCASCHEDPHEGRYVAACADCHGQHAFDQLEPIGHDAHLPLIGGHAEVACAECHVPDQAHSLDALGRGATVARRDCEDCHPSPHDAGFLRAVERQQPGSGRGGCVECHAAEHTTFGASVPRVTAEVHACSGFTLEPPHDQVDCAGCHDPELPTFAARYPGRDPDDCGACHEDPHGGQFASGPQAALGCVACHERQHFAPHAYDLEDHAAAGFTLDGQHAQADCEACHAVDEQSAVRIFRGTSSTCENCHDDAHHGFFDSVLQNERDPRGTCAHCHTTEAFDQTHADFDHARWTGFAVRGAHAQATCESCHPRHAEPDGLGRAFGRVADHFGSFRGCVTCHEDPHQGAFDGPEHPREMNGRRDCARCHVETSFRSFAAQFDHLTWTGFALEGAHGAVGCAECHAPLPEADAHGRTWARARGRDCADCHADPHAGQFAVLGRTNCERCHGTAESFSRLSFNHDIQSRFRLGEAHQDVACDKCHLPEVVGGAKIVRYRPLRTDCVHCHGAQETPLRRRRRGGR